MPVNTNDLEAAIRNAFPVDHLEITDQSSGCGESYSIVLVSEAFEGLSTLKKHRLINELLKAEIAQMHAFSQKTFTPIQYQAHLAKSR
ncbi:putative bolA-like protein C8C9.11 [Hypsizygus marmoreus]|uniref:BolA-like protein C8C9.11 n=1 Tax=Hypsizygus marmoreus TaxID=39966 RepID=A0A369JBY0_HYPMA|nr:putative bolA-like protein C8C9.11 [Hypsizygus marmoreus]